MQTTSTSIRTARTAGAIQEGSVRFQARQADFKERQQEVAALLDTILTDGQPEVFEGSTAYCTNYKLRNGFVGEHRCQAQLTSLILPGIGLAHVVRFWVYPGNFEVKCRDLVVLPSEAHKGYEFWLLADGRLFPHEGKYTYPAMTVLSNYHLGR